MATNKESDGAVLNHTAAADISSGDVVEFGADATGFIGIALADIASAAVGPVAVEGVWELAKDDSVGSGGAQGALAYWDGTAATADSTSNHLAGVFAETCADADTTCKVLLGR